MQFQHILPFIAGAIILCCGVLILARGTRSHLNFLFFFECLTLFFWLFFYSMMYASTDKSLALTRARFGFMGIAFIPVFIYHFYLKFLEIQQKNLIRSVYLIGGLFLCLAHTPLIYASIDQYWWGWYPVAGSFYPAFVLFFVVIFSHSLFLLYRSMNEMKPHSSVKYNQIKYLLVAFFVACFGIVDYIAKFRIALYPFGYVAALGWILAVSFTIVRYRLLDVRVVVTRISIFVIVYILVLGLPFALSIRLKPWFITVLGSQWWMGPLILMACLATLGPFIYIYLERGAEERLLKEQRRYQRTLKQASIGMTRIRDLRKLLELITHIVTKTVRISFAAVYLFNEEENQFRLQVARDRGRKFLASIPIGNPLIQWLLNNRQILIYEEMKRQRENTSDPFIRQIEENMRLLGAAVIIPSFLEDRFIGFIALGEKLSGQIYTPEDLNVFQILATQAALAIENAQFYEEAKRMQEQVAQAEKMATIGTMADGLSHQINNRFYALSLIASDSIDTIKMTDTTQCTPEVKEMLANVGRALERIQANVMQGGEVVKGILKYTRKGQEGFEPLTLDQIITGTLEMVQYKIKLSEVDIVRKYPADAPLIKGNQVQLQEAFFNLIDNAYDAIMERKQTLKEEGYKGRIEISIHPSDSGMMKIVIEDNGMGVKDSHNQKLFTPFFTTKISSRKGTGLGLYVIKRIITEMHGGVITFESQHGKGTKFMLTLPTA